MSGKTCMSNGRMRRFALLSAASFAVIQGAGLGIAPALAQSASDEARIEFNIAGGSVRDALKAFAATTGLQMVYNANIDTAAASPGVRGAMTAKEALARLLSGTGLTFRFVNAQTVTIDQVSAEGGERVLGAVRVEGAQNGTALAGATPVNGINGSRDVTATEGTGSYTSNALTIGSKTAATIKDTPMSVSVLTSQQMQDQNITDLDSAMRNLPGVSTVNNDGANQYKFYSRGFEITQVQFDGGAAMNTGGLYPFNRLIDMSLYDHVEIVRGAAGTFNAYGDPGGIINLVRKKPLDHVQLLTELQVGSWDWYRGMIDLTGPLAFDGKLRGRVIATHQDNRYFYDVAKASRNIFSATLELDATPTTLVSIGANYQDSNDLPFTSGLMRYQDGRSLNLPRSTCFCFNYASDKRKNVEFFGQVEQRIGNDWTAKFKATRIREERDWIAPKVSGAINPSTLQGAIADTGYYSYTRIRQTMFEATIDGYFRMFGRDQKLVAGVNYSMNDPSGSKAGLVYDLTTGAGFPFPGKASRAVDVFDFNPSDWKEPDFPSGTRLEYVYGDVRYLNAYLNLELAPIKRLHVTTGVRYAGYRSRTISRDVCAAWSIGSSGCQAVGQLVYYGVGNLNKGDDISWPPSIQARYDVTDNLTASAIYTDIYIDQSASLDRDQKPLPPITGGNFEGMLKWLSPDKKLNVTLSGYYIRQNGYSASDPICIVTPTNPVADPKCTNTNSTTTAGELNQSTSCCYVFNADQKNISYGADLEVAGEIRKGWQLSASYSYNRSYKNYQTNFDGQLTSLVSKAPRHKFQFWTTYAFEQGSRIPGLVLGLGAQAQSRTFVVSRYCAVYIPDTASSIPGAQTCATYKSVNFTEPGRIIFSASVGYKLNDHLRIDAQMENLLDKTYYETAGSVGSGNWYGAPRNIKVTLRGKF